MNKETGISLKYKGRMSKIILKQNFDEKNNIMYVPVVSLYIINYI